MRRIVASALICALLLSLSGCSGTFFASFFSMLGFDTYDYYGEEVIATLPPDSEEVAELTSLISMITMDTPELTAFSGAREAVSIYRDEILNSLLSASYSKYTGNIALLDKASAEYPQYVIMTIIPQEDFEYAVYKCFGGNEKITHADGSLFRYLPKVRAYTSVGQPQENCVKVEAVSCEETKSTFRLRFKCTVGDSTENYFALIIKRDDGTRYIKSLESKE